MSVKERIEELRKYAAGQEEISRWERKRLDAVVSTRIREELPGAQKQQHVLLEDLRKLGVLAMIEEMTEREIPSLIRREVVVPSPKSVADLRRLLGEKFEEPLRLEEWSAEVQYPQFIEGRWDGTLRIVVVKNDLRYQYPMPLSDEPKITVRYNKEGVLTIAGREVTFSGSIPNDKVKRVMLLEEAFAKAFRNPERKQPRMVEPPRDEFIGVRVSKKSMTL